LSGFRACAAATLVGSMPHWDRESAIDLILKGTPQIPVWPQLSSYQSEQMMVQYLEGLPGIQAAEGRTFLRTDTPGFEQELYGFYEEYLRIEANPGELMGSRFGMGPETGKTFFRFLEVVGEASSSMEAVKGQVVGPFTLLAGLKDQRDRSILYDERLQDVVVKHLAMKAKWQIQHLKSFGRPVIMFLDEPALAGFGSSAFISVSRELIHQLLEEVVNSIHGDGALAGIHICANTDWLLAFDSAVDIINLDAYNYMDKFALYRDHFLKYIDEGRIMAWGMVPTTDASIVGQVTARGLADRWLRNIEAFKSPTVDTKAILAQSFFTPSCGCGSLPEASAERVVELTRELGIIMRQYL